MLYFTLSQRPWWPSLPRFGGDHQRALFRPSGSIIIARRRLRVSLVPRGLESSSSSGRTRYSSAKNAPPNGGCLPHSFRQRAHRRFSIKAIDEQTQRRRRLRRRRGMDGRRTISLRHKGVPVSKREGRDSGGYACRPFRRTPAALALEDR